MSAAIRVVPNVSLLVLSASSLSEPTFNARSGRLRLGLLVYLEQYNSLIRRTAPVTQTRDIIIAMPGHRSRLTPAEHTRSEDAALRRL